MSKDVPRSGLRDKDLFEWEDVDTSDPDTAARLGLQGGAANSDATGALHHCFAHRALCPLRICLCVLRESLEL